MQNTHFFTFGNRAITIADVLVAFVVVLFLLILVFLIRSISNGRKQAIARALAETRALEMQNHLADVQKSQAEISGQMQAFANLLETRQSEMMRNVSERLDSVSQHMGQSITQNTKNTQESLAGLQERLAVIDKAQSNITALSDQVSGLQSILSNKQTRGIFGQNRMETIIKDGLPLGNYAFQSTLSNGKKPDCLIFMPNDTPPLAIDAKFPLEAWNNMREAETAQLDIKSASTQFARDMDVHIKAIAEKYLIPGETQDTAFLFVPSESIFADIHERFETIIQKAHRARIVIVSPSLLMLSIQVVQSVLKDANMREQAHLIQDEVRRLMEDVGRVDERVRKLQSHFNMAVKDVDDILISTSKVSKRGAKIDSLDFVDTPSDSKATVKAEQLQDKLLRS